MLDPLRLPQFRIRPFLGANPVEQQPGEWQLYELNEAFPMVVGVRPQPPPSGPEAKKHDAEKNLAREGRSVVTWGLAVPAAPDAWTVYTFQPEPPAGTQDSAGWEVPIPPECTRTDSLRVVGGGALVAFHGPQTPGNQSPGNPTPENWTDFYDRWFAGHNWKGIGNWRNSGPAWHKRFRAPDDESAGSVDVHFGPDDRGGAAGLLMITPST